MFVRFLQRWEFKYSARTTKAISSISVSRTIGIAFYHSSISFYFALFLATHSRYCIKRIIISRSSQFILLSRRIITSFYVLTKTMSQILFKFTFFFLFWEINCSLRIFYAFESNMVV